MHLSTLLFIFLPLSTFPCPPPFQAPIQTRETPQEYFLPQNVKPIRYRIFLEPNLEEETISGSVEIELQALENTNNVTIHLRSVEIDNSSVAVSAQSGKEVKHGDPLWKEDVEHYAINLEEELVQGENYTLKIGRYNGKLHSDNGGFYLAKYFDEDGNEMRLATTQFQSTNARRAFPCFDEPAFKANFIVSLVRSENYSSISNEVIEESRQYKEKYLIDTYKETVKMSTYLAAFVVSDFDFVAKGTQKVYARPQAIREGLADYSLWTGVEILKILETYLDYEYTPSKMDQIAIPDDYFAAGAMENWGLVTYRETYLLYSEKFSTSSELQRILTVIAHEFAHQWFGNLVTLAWWEYLWLNEGFATYFEYRAAGELEPDWKLMEQFVPEAVQYALRYDSSESTEAMNYATPYPGGGAPSYISYEKGGSVIRMFEHFLTTEVFKAALNYYLKYREYKAVVPEDLYYSLQVQLNQAGKTGLLGGYNVSTILTSWDSFKGYPIVNIRRIYENGSLILTQERFFQKQSITNNETHNWYIPVNFVFSSKILDFSNTTADYWFVENQTVLSNSYPTDGFLIANKQQTGFYRVNYDQTNWKRIIDYLNSDDFENIHVLNRAQLLDDAFHLARAGQLSYETALELSSFLERETNYIVWSSFFSTLNFLEIALSSNGNYENFKLHILHLANKYYEDLGPEEAQDDSHVKKLARSTILPYLCRYGHEECRQKALESLQEWEADEEQIFPPNLQVAFFCTGIAEGDEDDWNFLYSQYYATPQTRSNQRLRIINGLGCSQTKRVLYNYMNLAINKSSDLETKHRSRVFTAVYSSGSFGLRTAFDFVKENYDEVKSSSYLTTILSGIGSFLTTKEQLEELKALKEEHAGDTESFVTAISNAEENVQWTEHNIAAVSSWLELRVINSSEKTSCNVIFVLTIVLMTLLIK